MSDVEIDNNSFVDSILTVKNVHIKSKHQIKSEHILPLKNVWSIVRKLTHNEILYFGYRILEYNPTALYVL